MALGSPSPVAKQVRCRANRICYSMVSERLVESIVVKVILIFLT